MFEKTVMLALGVGVVMLGAIARADSLETPTGPTVLTVTGAIANTNGEGSARFDRRMLSSLGQIEIRTTTDWTDGATRFRGPKLRDVLDAVGAAGGRLTATALNDYAIQIPIQDAQDYDVILAMEQDGEPLSIRTKGPIWIVYPRDDHDELRSVEFNSRWIWQLASLHVE